MNNAWCYLMPMFDEYKQLIEQAEERVYQAARRTELDYAPQLSELLGNRVHLKREDRQEVFSYKIRGAFNMMSALTEEQRARGVLAASAGNHAQGVAMAASRLYPTGPKPRPGRYCATARMMTLAAAPARLRAKVGDKKVPSNMAPTFALSLAGAKVGDKKVPSNMAPTTTLSMATHAAVRQPN